MFRARRSPAPFVDTERRTAAGVVLLLALVFAAAVALTIQTLRAASSQRSVAEHALRDVADQAAWNIGANIEARLYIAMVAVFREMGGRAQTGATFAPPPRPSLVHTAIDRVRACQCATVLDPRVTFAYDWRTHQLHTAGDALSPEEHARLVDTLRTHAAQVYDRVWDYALVHLPGATAPRPVFYTVRRDAQGNPLVLFGFEARSASLERALFAAIVEQAPAIPTASAIPNDSLLHLRIRSAEGASLFSTATTYAGGYTGAAFTGRNSGSLRIEATLNPAMASRLLPGAGSRTPVALILLILATTGGLLVLAGVLFARASALARSRAGFLSSVSHELRTPLAQILLYGETMQLGRLRGEDAYQREAGVIVEEARHLLALIENVLHAARLGAAELPLRPEPVALGEVVAAVAATMQGRVRAANASLHVASDDDTTVLGDRAALRCVVRNLVDNALKYGAGSTVEVMTRRDNGSIELQVADGGPGIDAATRERIWEPFQRGGDAANASTGSGLGLAVVRDLVRRQGGHVDATTNARGGASFHVWLPAAPERAP
jgi:signal transduction histidine kinase